MADDPSIAALAASLRVLSGKLKRRLRENTDLAPLSWPQVAVLAHLDRNGPTTITALAKAEAMRSQSMGAIISVLHKAGLVTAQPHATDGRQVLYTLTDLSRERLAAARATRDDWLCQTIRNRLTGDEQKTLGQAIGLLERLVDR